MEIRLSGSPKELDETVELLKQIFDITKDGGNYKGRNPRYTNSPNVTRYLTISPNLPSKTGKETGVYHVAPTDHKPRPDDAVLGGGKPEND